MNIEKMAKLALKAIRKRWDYEELKYGDDLNGDEESAWQVWDLVEECQKIGSIAFKEKYGV